MHYRRRNSLRYPRHDYAEPGAVFVTVCTSGKQRLFGDVQDGQIIHSPAGLVAVNRWQMIPDRFAAVEIDAFVIMPDHVHGVLFTGANPDLANQRITVGDVIRWFKASVQSAYRHGVEHLDWPAYDRHLWQRGFHDRIIRSDVELATIQTYIEGNPWRLWARQNDDLDMGQS
jgi:REP element-mobilizing transposase RayT